MAGFNLGDIFVTFKSKTEDLKRGAQEVKNMTEGASDKVNKMNFSEFSSRASNAFGGVANAIQGVVTKVALLATAGGVGITGFIKSAADLQQTSKSFEVLTGNVEIANKLFAQLARYANTTPFEFPQIAKAGQILLGFGIKSDDVYKRITMLGDIAAATGANFESLALVFGQVNATGKLMGQDALQLINNKIPITGILAKKLGVSVQEVKKRMEEGKISADLFNEALAQQTEKGGFAFKGTEILAQSLNGRLSTLKDTVLEFGRNLLGVKVDPELGLVIKPGGVFDRFSSIVPRITSGLSEMAPKVERVISFIVDHGKEVMAVVVGIAAAFVAAKLASIAFATQAALAGPQAPFVIAAIAITALIGVLAALQTRFNWIGKTLEFLKPYWEAFVRLFNEAFKPSVEALGRVFIEKLLPALMQVWDALKRVWDAINPALTEGLKILGTIIGVAIVAQTWIFINVLNLVIQALAGVISFISNVIKWIANLIGWYGNLQAAGINLVVDIIGWFGKIPGAMGAVVMAIRDWWRQLPGWLQGIAGALIDSVVGPWKFAFNLIAKLWNDTVGKLTFKAPDWIPNFGGKGWSMPKLPTLALGTPDWRGGMVRMNEFGPETAILPPGTRVITADQTRKNQSSGGGNNYYFQLDGILARSDSELADIIEGAINALDRRNAGAGKPQILGGRA